MNRIKNIVLLLLLPLMTFANAYVAVHQSYPESEDLVINLDSDNARISGQFVFRSSPSAERHSPDAGAMIIIPVWIPVTPDSSQTNLISFLDTFSTSELNWIKDETKPILDTNIGLKIDVGGEAIPYDTFAIFTYNDFSKELGTNTYMRPDIYEARFREFFHPSHVTNGTPVSIEYTQPLLKSDGSTFLFYVPYLLNIENGDILNNKERYKIKVHCDKKHELIPHSKHVYHTSPTSTELVIVPQHHKPIIVELKNKANQRLEPIASLQAHP